PYTTLFRSFDHWGEKHHTTTSADTAADLDRLLAAGASVNIYMVHGGTNFGLTAGANDSGRYLPMVTSYDYDSPITESGDLTDKFRAFRDVIAKHAPVPDEPLPEPVAAPTPTASLDRRVRQHLHGPRGHELRTDRGSERLRPVPADGDELRLRFPHHRVRRPHRQVPRLPRRHREARAGARRAAARAGRRADPDGIPRSARPSTSTWAPGARTSD